MIRASSGGLVLDNGARGLCGLLSVLPSVGRGWTGRRGLIGD